MKQSFLFLSLFSAASLIGSNRVLADNVPPPPPPPAAASSAEGAAAAAAHRAAGFRELHKFIETNGKITKEQFLAHAKKEAEERFSKLDSNGDGAIDKAELEAAASKLRGLRDKLQERGKGGSVRKRPGSDDKNSNPTNGTGSKPTT